MKKIILKVSVLVSALFISFQASAWNHGISFGYGSATDPNHSSDTNSGYYLSGKLFLLSKRSWYQLTLDGSIGDWKSSTQIHNDLFTTALSADFRIYFFHLSSVHGYAYIASGPGYLSNRRFGQNTQASNFAFQSTFGTGLEFGKAKRLDLTLNFVHFSNAYLMHPNEGFNIFYVVSVGYLF